MYDTGSSLYTVVYVRTLNYSKGLEVIATMTFGILMVIYI